MALNFDKRNNLIGTIEIGENSVLYGQDFSHHRGVPPGEYQIFILGDGGYKLVAPGYGDLSKPGQYGNGALYVPKSEMANFPDSLIC